MRIVFDHRDTAVEFARQNSLIAYRRGDEFVTSDEKDGADVARWDRRKLIYEPCPAGGLHYWGHAPNRDGSVSDRYWCVECHADPPSVAIVGAQGWR